jgi:hypothetical protein
LQQTHIATIMKFATIRACWPALLVCALATNSPAFRSACPVVLAADGGGDQKPETLNNAAIIELEELNLGDRVIIDKIRTSRCDFDVTVAALKQLKELKVSNDVIKAMIDAEAPPPAVSPATATKPSGAANNEPEQLPAGDVNDPNTYHDPGVWLYGEVNGVRKMAPLNAESYRIWTGGGPFAFGSAQRAVLAGVASKTQVSSRRPVFYMYFGGANKNGLGIMATTTPDQLPLARLELKTKTRERLLVIGSVSVFAGYNSGIPKKYVREFDSEKIGPGAYRVTPAKDLSDGEYAFCFYAGQVQVGAAGRMFTFGVHLK